MDNKVEFDRFVRDIEQYSIPDLELIYQTQKELYSQEELEAIKKVLDKKKASSKQLSPAEQQAKEFNFGVTLFCIVGVLTPISGFVAGIIMLIKGSARWKAAGKKILLASLISVVLRLFLLSGGFVI